MIFSTFRADLLTRCKSIGRTKFISFPTYNVATMLLVHFFEVDDLGIKKSIMLNYGFKNLPSEHEIEALSKRNNRMPFNVVAAWYLWESINDKSETN